MRMEKVRELIALAWPPENVEDDDFVAALAEVEETEARLAEAESNYEALLGSMPIARALRRGDDAAYAERLEAERDRLAEERNELLKWVDESRFDPAFTRETAWDFFVAMAEVARSRRAALADEVKP